MKQYIDILTKILEASHDGFDIILSELPQAEVCRANPKKKFKLRNEQDASACLYPPTSNRNHWAVYDFGGPEGERQLSPIDIVMRQRGLDFWPALQTLAEEYGVDAKLSSNVNKPIISQRTATVDEIDGQEYLTLREGFSAEGLAVWGNGLKPEVLQKLGWSEVEQITKTKNRVTTVITRTENYPIFRQRCFYKDAQDNPTFFDKVYEPLNPQKQFRFHSIGTKPRGYIFGLDAVIAEYQNNQSNKLDAVLLVSGGSDAVACWSRGVPAVYMGSERDCFGSSQYKQVMLYCKQLYNVPDIDATGVDEGKKKALELQDMKTIWLNQDDMYGLHDKRGGNRKDLKDYLDLHPETDAIWHLRNRGIKACFWDYIENQKTGEVKIVISPTRLDYMLWLLGFSTLRDNNNDAPDYLQFSGNKVKHVVSKTIRNYLLQYAEHQGWPESVRDKIRTTTSMPTAKKSTLREVSELNILQATATSQPLFFRNCWVTVTKDGVERHSYKEISEHYIWEDRIIPHDYVEMPKMFEISLDDKENYQVIYPNGMQSKLMQVCHNSSRLYWRKVDEDGQELTEEEEADEARNMVSRIANAGYNLHNYKSLAAAYATVCVDNKMGTTKSEQNGRSGKSVYLNAIGGFVNCVYREAKRREDVDSRFFFGGTTEENGLFVIDECHSNFDVGQIYGRITGPFLVEQKGEPIRTIPFDVSPKIALATNSVITKHDQTTEGRLWYQTFSDYYHIQTEENDYNESRSVRDDIGCVLMDKDYPEVEWQKDIAFIIQCLQYHLSLPQKEWKVTPPMRQIRQREQQASISMPVAEWAKDYLASDAGHLNTEIPTHVIYGSFVSDTKSKMSNTAFTKQLKAYCKFIGLIYNPASITKKDKDGEPYVAYIREQGKACRCVYIQSLASTEDNQSSSVQDINTIIEEALPF